MELIQTAIDWVLHLDKHLNELIGYLGPWAYAVFFLIIFCETGLVVTPFLPGDSFLFALGTLAAGTDSKLDLMTLIVLLSIAAVLGDTVNYWIGHFIGPKVFHREDVRFLNKRHLDRTHEFYERYGGKTIIFARFIPIIRTFAPFVAGIGRMSYFRFMSYNVIGGILWIVSMTLAGYFFGNFPVVKNNFTLVILAIIFISILPGIIEFLRERAKTKRNSRTN
jgi:membrane-associated protein